MAYQNLVPAYLSVLSNMVFIPRPQRTHYVFVPDAYVVTFVFALMYLESESRCRSRFLMHVHFRFLMQIG